MKFTLTTNLILAAAIVFIVGATTYNQIHTTGVIDIAAIGKAILTGVLGLQAILAHHVNPDGTSARVVWDPTRDKEALE